MIALILDAAQLIPPAHGSDCHHISSEPAFLLMTWRCSGVCYLPLFCLSEAAALQGSWDVTCAISPVVQSCSRRVYVLAMTHMHQPVMVGRACAMCHVLYLSKYVSVDSNSCYFMVARYHSQAQTERCSQDGELGWWTWTLKPQTFYMVLLRALHLHYGFVSAPWAHLGLYICSTCAVVSNWDTNLAVGLTWPEDRTVHLP